MSQQGPMIINNKSGRSHVIMSPEEAASGKKSHWSELEIAGKVSKIMHFLCSFAYNMKKIELMSVICFTGNVRNISLALFDMTHLTHLYINDNTVTKLPMEIGRLYNLVLLDASNNKLRCLPPELGDLVRLKELYLANNYIRHLPLEMGRLFNVQILNLKGNPLPQELLQLQSEVNGTQKLLTLLLDALPCK